MIPAASARCPALAAPSIAPRLIAALLAMLTLAVSAPALAQAPANDQAGTTAGQNDNASTAQAEEEVDPIAVAEAAQEPTTIATFFPRFWRYFGLPGVLLVLLALATVVWLLRFTLSHRGGRFVWAGVLVALGIIAMLLYTRTTGSIDLALLAAVLLVGFTIVLLFRLAPVQWPVVVLALAVFAVGEWSSTRVSAIEVDNAAEEARLRQAREEQARQQAQQAGAGIAEGRMAVEMSEEDKQLLEQAAEEDDERSEYERAAEQEELPLYMQRGKQQRDPSRVSDGENGDDESQLDTDLGIAEARALPPGDVTRANRWDVFLLVPTRWAPWIGLFVVFAAYLDRFNRGAGARAPLPLSNRAFDGLYPKPLVARVADDAEAVPAMLREIVNKGESFIYLGADDPLPDAGRLERLMLTPKLGTWDMPKLCMAADEAEHRHPFVFESAWFRRLCFIVIADEARDRFVDRLIERLTMRRVTKAVARRTLNLFFDGQAVPDRRRLDELVRLARRANVKIYLRPDADSAQPPDDLFDEVIRNGQATLLQPAAAPSPRRVHPSRDAAPVMPG